MVSVVTVLSASDLAYDWRSWSDVPVIFLRCRPLTTLGRPTPTAVAGSQWGEPRSEAFATDARVAGSSVTVAGPAAPNGQPLVLAVSEAVNPDLSCWGRGTWGRLGAATLFGRFHTAEPSTVLHGRLSQSSCYELCQFPLLQHGMARPTFGLPPSRAALILSLIASVGLLTV